VTTVATPALTDAVVAFAGNAWAFREPVRAAARPFVCAVVIAALAGATSERVTIALATLDAGTPRLRARAVGRVDARSPIDAAFLTALAAAGDGCATPVAAAALAAGDATGSGGAMVLDAFIAGFEVAVRLERALGASFSERGWDVRGTAGRIGAAIAAARVLGLQRGPLRDAIGIAATASSGLRSAAGTMTCAFVPAAAAADGVEAALLARAEFTGAPAAIEGRRGVGALMSGAFEASAVTGGLGETFAFASLAPDASARVTEDERSRQVRAVVDRMERLPAIADLLVATQ
jgi:2-methylcitrate dehydratase PrpD